MSAGVLLLINIYAVLVGDSNEAHYSSAELK